MSYMAAQYCCYRTLEIKCY